MGHQEVSCVAWIVKGGVLSTSFLVFFCFHIKSPTVSVGCSLLNLGEGMGEEGEERPAEAVCITGSPCEPWGPALAGDPSRDAVECLPELLP